MHHQAGVNFENFTDVKFRDILLIGTGHRDRRLNRDSPGPTYGRSNLNQNRKPKSNFRFIREKPLAIPSFDEKCRPGHCLPLVGSLLEHFILSNISPFLGTTDNQFGFKAGHSTDQCTFLLMQTASYFVTHGSSAHTVFLDASKAFDRVLHMKLFENLIQRKVPMCFVRPLKHWYKEQTMQIK